MFIPVIKVLSLYFSRKCTAGQLMGPVFSFNFQDLPLQHVRNPCVKRYWLRIVFIILPTYIFQSVSLISSSLISLPLALSVRVKNEVFPGTSLVAQLLRICLPMHGTWVWSLVREDTTCRGTTKPVCHNYWVCALEPVSHKCWAHVPRLLKPAHVEPVLRNKRSHRNEKPANRNEE